MEPAYSHSRVIAIYVLREDRDYAIFDVQLGNPPVGDPENYDCQAAFEVYVDQDGQPDFAWSTSTRTTPRRATPSSCARTAAG